MRDKLHDDAMAELLYNDPEYARELLSAVEMAGDQAELAIVRRQLIKAADLAPNERSNDGR
ncbi:transcriptional regulator [Pseudomonas viridiflava]|uniref:transcriptional regulator n=1 Tax=Pseudomonas viridiflava TaxID=33069 RepID=UPI000F02DF41|nr:transcriptional regulator [Pseudomonas viridiflava]